MLSIVVARRVRLKLLGDGWHAYGGVKIPDDREVVVTEAEAAAFLSDRGSARSVEIVGWVDEDTEGETAERARRARRKAANGFYQANGASDSSTCCRECSAGSRG